MEGDFHVSTKLLPAPVSELAPNFRPVSELTCPFRTCSFYSLRVCCFLGFEAGSHIAWAGFELAF